MFLYHTQVTQKQHHGPETPWNSLLIPRFFPSIQISLFVSLIFAQNFQASQVCEKKNFS